jgi:hypothetical protein
MYPILARECASPETETYYRACVPERLPKTGICSLSGAGHDHVEADGERSLSLHREGV